MSTISSPSSLFSWMGIALISFFAAISADMAHLSKPTVVIIGLSTFILTTLLMMALLGWLKDSKEAPSTEEINDDSDDSPKIPLIQLRDEAIKRGWDFAEGSEQSLAFTLAISQAGLDCEIQFWGRKESSDSESMNRSNELKPIPAGHWLQFAVEPVRFVSSRDNFFVRSYEFPSLEVKAYLDLYVNSDQAMQWLSSTAEQTRNPDIKET